MTPKAIQTKLIALGYNLGPSGADGVWGRRSIAALRAFQAARGLPVTGVPNDLTLARLDPHGPVAAIPVWHAEALRLKGLRETAGQASNPVILGWAKAVGGFARAYYKGDDIPWCGLFQAHCLGSTLPEEPLPANPLSALAWAKLGLALPAGRVGAIVVFRRPGGGHVGQYVGEDADAIHVLGGNQSDAVTIARVAKSRLVGIRWPKTAPLPSASGGRVADKSDLKAGAPLSANEA